MICGGFVWVYKIRFQRQTTSEPTKQSSVSRSPRSTSLSPLKAPSTGLQTGIISLSFIQLVISLNTDLPHQEVRSTSAPSLAQGPLITEVSERRDLHLHFTPGYWSYNMGTSFSSLYFAHLRASFWQRCFKQQALPNSCNRYLNHISQSPNSRSSVCRQLYMPWSFSSRYGRLFSLVSECSSFFAAHHAQNHRESLRLV